MDKNLIWIICKDFKWKRFNWNGNERIRKGWVGKVQIEKVSDGKIWNENNSIGEDWIDINMDSNKIIKLCCINQIEWYGNGNDQKISN